MFFDRLDERNVMVKSVSHFDNFIKINIFCCQHIVRANLPATTSAIGLGSLSMEDVGEQELDCKHAPGGVATASAMLRSIVATLNR